MKTLLLIFLFIPLFLQAQWVQKINLNSLTQSFDACDENIAVAAQWRGIYYTLDGGNSWNHKSLKNLIPSTTGLTDISLVNENNVWICTDDGKIIKGALNNTTDWYVQYEYARKAFCNYIKMFDANNGIAMFDGDDKSSALVLKTTNGGQNWIDANNLNLVGMYASGGKKLLDFADLNFGLFSATKMSRVSDGNKFLFRTTDGSQSWQVLPIENEEYFVNIKMYNRDIAIACVNNYSKSTGSKFNIYFSQDGGLTWATCSQPEDTPAASDLEFVPGKPKSFWVSIKNKLYFTSDAGKTFSLQLTAESEWIPEIVFINDKVGWLVCNNGKIFKTTNGAIVGIHEDLSIVPTKVELYQNFPNPFNPETTISYSIPKSEHVTLKVYDLLGREVATLVDEFKQVGTYNSQFSIRNYQLTAGVYFYRLQSGSYSETKKFMLMK